MPVSALGQPLVSEGCCLHDVKYSPASFLSAPAFKTKFRNVLTSSAARTNSLRAARLPPAMIA